MHKEVAVISGLWYIGDKKDKEKSQQGDKEINETLRTFYATEEYLGDDEEI